VGVGHGRGEWGTREVAVGEVVVGEIGLVRVPVEETGLIRVESGALKLEYTGSRQG
jgi:hypothetical protein